MGLFDSAEEQARKANLKKMEDKRVAFAQALDRQGFKPDEMLFASTPNGGYAAICVYQGKRWLIVSPGFGTDEDFTIEAAEHLNARAEPVSVKAEGMGGMFGFGKRSEEGVEYVVTRADGTEVRVPFVYGRTSWNEFSLKKNPLLDTRRRKGNANVAWELKPIDSPSYPRILAAARYYILGDE